MQPSVTVTVSLVACCSFEQIIYFYATNYYVYCYFIYRHQYSINDHFYLYGGVVHFMILGCWPTNINMLVYLKRVGVFVGEQLHIWMKKCQPHSIIAKYKTLVQFERVLPSVNIDFGDYCIHHRFQLSVTKYRGSGEADLRIGNRAESLSKIYALYRPIREYGIIDQFQTHKSQ